MNLFDTIFQLKGTLVPLEDVPDNGLFIYSGQLYHKREQHISTYHSVIQYLCSPVLVEQTHVENELSFFLCPDPSYKLFNSDTKVYKL